MRKGQMTEIGTDANWASFGAPVAADAALIALERQFKAVFSELLAMERLCAENPRNEALTRQIEMVLTRLAPIEQAIMQTQARTIGGLGVKARHLAHVMSQYWDPTLDQLDWEERAVRLFVEAVCNVARTPPQGMRDDE
jgi:hypothetical protein